MLIYDWMGGYEKLSDRFWYPFSTTITFQIEGWNENIKVYTFWSLRPKIGCIRDFMELLIQKADGLINQGSEDLRVVRQVDVSLMFGIKEKE